MNDIDDCGLLLFEGAWWESRFILWKRTIKELKIVGVMETTCQNGPWEVYKVAAQDGYGPWLYIQAMITHKELSPNQEEGHVSPAASRVWEYFYNEGTETEELDDSPHYEEWLRRIYKADYTITDYETELADAVLKTIMLSEEEIEELKSKAEEYIDSALERVYGPL